MSRSRENGVPFLWKQKKSPHDGIEKKKKKKENTMEKMYSKFSSVV